MRSLKFFSLGLLANFGQAHPPLFSNPKNDHYLQRSRRDVIQPLADDSELGAELSFLYDICSQADFETHVLKNSENTSISCVDTENEGLSCQLSCDRGYYVSETVEDSRLSSVSFNCYKLPFARNYYYWTYAGSDDQADYKKCFFDSCPSGVDIGSSLFQFKEQFSKRATAEFTVNQDLINQKLTEAGISTANSDFANDGWTFVVQFNQALSTNSKTSFHVGNGRYLSTNKNGNAIAFTSFEENRDITSLGDYTLDLTFSSVDDGFLPDDFAVESIELTAGEFTNVQCRFGHENITSAGVWSDDLGYTVSLSNNTQAIEADFDENVVPFEFGGVYSHLAAGGTCENSEPEAASLSSETIADLTADDWYNFNDVVLYKVFEGTRLNWEDARQACNDLGNGATLARLYSQEEADFLVMIPSTATAWLGNDDTVSTGHTYITGWLGGYEIGHEGHWLYATTDYPNGPEELVTWTNWSPMHYQENDIHNVGMPEECMLMWAKWFGENDTRQKELVMNDSYCHFTKPSYYCEIRL